MWALWALGRIEKCGDVYKAASHEGEIFWPPISPLSFFSPFGSLFFDIEGWAQWARMGRWRDIYEAANRKGGIFGPSFSLLRYSFSPFLKVGHSGR